MIQGAVYTDRLIVQNLCDGIYVGRDNVFDADLLWRLTHVFECVTHLIANLDVLYARLAARLSQVSPSDLPALLKLEPEDNHQRFFPHSGNILANGHIPDTQPRTSRENVSIRWRPECRKRCVPLLTATGWHNGRHKGAS